MDYILCLFSPHPGCFSSPLSIFTYLLSPPWTPPFLCLYLSVLLVAPSNGVIILSSAPRLSTPQGSEVARLTVTYKLRPHREILSLLSPAASLLVCAYVHLVIILPWLAVLLNYYLVIQKKSRLAEINVSDTVLFSFLYICARLKV